MKKCADCGGKMEERESMMPDGISYRYFACTGCGEEILNMEQLEAVAMKYRLLKVYRAKMTQWGQSLGLRIPKKLVAQYHFKPNAEVSLIPEKEGIRIVSGKN